LKALFEQVAKPLAEPATRGSWYRTWRVLAVDGTTFDVPDTPENAGRFGRPGSARSAMSGGRAAFPQVRVVAVAECGTHAIVAATLGPITTAEATLAREFFPGLGEGRAADRRPGVHGAAVMAGGIGERDGSVVAGACQRRAAGAP
jgi:hypothetical protein